MCKHRFNLFWWRKMQVDGEQVSCGLSFVLFAWNENTCNHRCKSKSRIFLHLFSICVTSYHFLIPSSFMSLWHNNVKHVPCILCCIHLSHKQPRKDWGGGGIKSTFEQIWSAAWWPGLGGQQVSDARTRRKLAQIHENLLWLCQWNTQFTIHCHSIVSFLELKLKLCVSTATLS